MKKSKIALKPYLDTITGYCRSLSNQELTDMIVTLAKDVPTSGRVNFLEKIKSCLPDGRTASTPDLSPAELTLDNIQALKENIEERIESIEDGSYWDEPGHWSEDGYYDEEPEYVSEDQADELESIFVDAESLFLNDRLAEARQVFEALFKLIEFVNENAYYSPRYEVDIREARARFCRCVYETSGADKRLDEFAAAICAVRGHLGTAQEPYPPCGGVCPITVARHQVGPGRREGLAVRRVVRQGKGPGNERPYHLCRLCGER
jgi:hypothetical protein